MIRDSAVDLLMGRLGKRQNTFTQQDIINEMVFVQDTILEGDPTPYWFLLSEKADTVTTPDEERIQQPDDFLQEWEEGALYIQTTDGEEVAMVKDDWDVIKYKITGTGQPEYYALAGQYFLLRKIPNDVYPLLFRYYSRQASLAGTYGATSGTDGNVENNWLRWASDLFIAETGIIISRQYLQSDKMVELFAAQAQQARKRLTDKDTIMRETNVQRFMEG